MNRIPRYTVADLVDQIWEFEKLRIEYTTNAAPDLKLFVDRWDEVFSEPLHLCATADHFQNRLMMYKMVAV